jgi:rod shape-determining protein MreB
VGLKNDSDYMDKFTTNDDFLYLGIDAGMFKTSVCTSDGNKISERTVVALLNDDSDSSTEKVLFGEDALESQVDNIREILNIELKTEEDVIACGKYLKNILEKHDVNMSRVNTYAILGVPSNAQKAYKKKLLELSREIFSGAMLVDGIFCMAYRYDFLDNSVLVDIGCNKTNICIISGDVPQETDCLSLPCAGKDIDMEIVKLINERWPDSNVTEELAREWKEKYGHLGPSSDPCIVTVPLESGDIEESIAEEVQIACEFVVTDIVSGITRILSDVDPGIRESLRNNIHIFGGTSKLLDIGTFIEGELKELGGGDVFLDLDSVYGISEGALELARNMPMEFWKQPVVGKQDEELI